MYRVRPGCVNSAGVFASACTCAALLLACISARRGGLTPFLEQRAASGDAALQLLHTGLIAMADTELEAPAVGGNGTAQNGHGVELPAPPPPPGLPFSRPNSAAAAPGTPRGGAPTPRGQPAATPRGGPPKASLFGPGAKPPSGSPATPKERAVTPGDKGGGKPGLLRAASLRVSSLVSGTAAPSPRGVASSSSSSLMRAAALPHTPRGVGSATAPTPRALTRAASATEALPPSPDRMAGAAAAVAAVADGGGDASPLASHPLSDGEEGGRRGEASPQQRSPARSRSPTRLEQLQNAAASARKPSKASVEAGATGDEGGAAELGGDGGLSGEGEEDEEGGGRVAPAGPWRAPSPPPPAPSASSWRPAVCHALNAPLGDAASFVSAPGPEGGANCHVRRLQRGRAPVYALYLEGPNEGRVPGHPVDARFLLCARRAGRGAAGGSKYDISLDPPADDAGARPAGGGRSCGSVSSNFLGTQFSGCDGDGREVAAVTFGFNLLGMNGPRKMSAAITHGDGVRVLRAKAPRYNPSIGAFCLNFHGRVAMASVKNFQLEEEVLSPDEEGAPPPPPAAPVLQFGKVNEELFTMDFGHPISALQAFMVCIASCDSKLACE